MEETDSSVQRDSDAVCFSAGVTGVAFGAGVIHAYLASDRQPPKVIAGISLGALTATAMERCYHSMGASPSEAERWKWFRRYLSFLLDHPYDVLWDAIPNPSDFLADLPPVQDPGLPVDPASEKGEAYALAKDYDVQARRRLHLLARAGQWLARIPVNVSAVAWLVVRYVRMKEQYPKPRLLRTWNCIALIANLFWIEWRLILHAVLCPLFFPEWQFKVSEPDEEQKPAQKAGTAATGQAAFRMVKGRFWFRPLFGWRLWFVFTILTAATFALLATEAFVVANESPHPWPLAILLLLFLALPPLVTWLLTSWESFSNWTRKWILLNAAEGIGLRKSLAHNFRLRLKLFRLLGEAGHVPKLTDCVGGGDTKLILVAAPLQILPSLSKKDQSTEVILEQTPVQLWPTGDVSLLRALQASLAFPGLFEPFRVVDDDAKAGWLIPSVMKRVPRLDLVDGSKVRQNPLPALFSFLHREENKIVAEQLSRPGSRIYLVYDVPILPGAAPPDLPEDSSKQEPMLPNIIDTAFAGRRLARRRDSRLEVMRTNHISRIEECLRLAIGKPTSNVLTATVDDIAPEMELHLGNALQPTETEILTHVAAGCRQTLGVLYRKDLAGPKPVPCGEFLIKMAPGRKDALGSVPGASEVCRHCTRKLVPAITPVDNLLPPSFQAAKTAKGDALLRTFPGLAVSEPRIVFLASGGVFRGSFHIGMLGALLAANIKPDMIVGASVGTLMGSVLGAMFSSASYGAAQKKLERLAHLFVDVDQKVALTRTFKAAMKDLGIRARSRSLQISPNDLRKMVMAGSRSDSGLAATGAPPALIDAISDLFLIPYKQTTHVASEFMAGHVPRALKLFWTQIKKETIERLGVRDAVIGATLLEREIPLLLGTDHLGSQPFLAKNIAFFATTVDLITEWPRILGAEMDLGSYDLVEALLSSCAFPAAFSPRRASSMYPGAGRRDVFFGDGGMFDNLPFIPAIQILRDVRQQKLESRLGQGLWREELLRRHRNPDLFLVGALEVKQQPGDPKQPYDVLTDIWSRAVSLGDNEKIYGFEHSARKIDKQLAALEEVAAPASIPEKEERFLNGVVNTAILPVYPSSKTCLNGTFHFCHSLGMRRDRIRRSIADGCFRTIHQMATTQNETADSLRKRSVDSLTAAGRLPRISIDRKERPAGQCPFFVMTAAPDKGLGKLAPRIGAKEHPFPCPFYRADGIYKSCCEESEHIRLTTRL